MQPYRLFDGPPASNPLNWGRRPQATGVTADDRATLGGIPVAPLGILVGGVLFHVTRVCWAAIKGEINTFLWLFIAPFPSGVVYWERTHGRWRTFDGERMSVASHPEAVILFDGVCNLCNAWVSFVIDHDRSETFAFGAQQSPGGHAMLDALHYTGPDLAGIILVTDGRVYTDSTAILEICARLPRPWQFAAFLRVIPRPVRDAVYRWIARHRYRWFGRTPACRVPTPELQRRFLV